MPVAYTWIRVADHGHGLGVVAVALSSVLSASLTLTPATPPARPVLEAS